MRTWPDLLDPPVSDGYKVTPVDQAIRTDMEVGTSRQRRITKARRDNISASIRMNDAQFEAFRVWYGDEYWSAAGDSEDISLWTRNAFTRVALSLAGPDSAICDQLVETTATDSHKASMVLDSHLNLNGLTINVMATLSAVGRTFGRLAVFDRAGVEHYAVVNLSTGAVSSSSGATVSITDRGIGWWRVLLTLATGSGGSDVTMVASLMSDAVTTTYAGNIGKSLGICEICAHEGNDIFVRTSADGYALGAAGGAAWFGMPLAVGRGLQVLETKFTGPWDASALPGLGWTVIMPFEVRNA